MEDRNSILLSFAAIVIALMAMVVSVLPSSAVTNAQDDILILKLDHKYLNEPITTINQPDGKTVRISRKHLLDYVILKNIEEAKQRQALEKTNGR